MAPTKKDAKEEKEAKLTPQQSADLIMDYLRKQNRPYSATDVSTNLKNRVSKAATAKLLKDMHERKEIEGRAAGKQLIYHVIQDDADEADLEKLQEMDAETSRLKSATLELKAEEKDLRQTLRQEGAQVPLPELRVAVDTLRQEEAELSARLATLKHGNTKSITIEEREQINSEHRKWSRTAAARKKIRKELWAEIESHLGKEKAAETKEMLGLEF
ncbi:hypothetical protein KC340_g18173 [Hortaea werneckii]|nr:hypothetical protein KC342_g17022 [Hortaea werneckii]KAI7106214.1 hypothetical protein KC339_g3262 [Hortaea werneckii]KAI7209410.1 hypothetical protein KC365_g15694 [Hortaea werneckii]KAI7286765.1 hypothetical protein KC340_g18173 [Hortaea werneckii]KAI7373370.1 hypothetical protein KC328_g16663 [Hortaea werneckii]